MTEDEERAKRLPDADYRFAPLEVPPEDPMRRMAIIDMEARFVLEPCPHCQRTLTPLEMAEGSELSRAIGVSHQQFCPYWVPDE